jgi:hypothetical protein
MMQELDEINASLARLRHELCGLKFQIGFRKWIHGKAGFDPDQPRDEHGMWTDGGGDNSVDQTPAAGDRVSAVFADVASMPLDLLGSQLVGEDGDESAEKLLQEVAASITDDDARTGIPTIDETTDRLSTDLIRVMDNMEFIPDRTPQAYGVAVHAAFATSVRAADYPGIGRDGVEQSFLLNEVVQYGFAGSIRTDVVLRDVTGDVIAIYDVKTGGAVLSSSRADQLRERTGALPNTPVIELHFFRGSSLKHEQVAQDLRGHSSPYPGHGGVRALPDRQADRLYRARLSSRVNAA